MGLIIYAPNVNKGGGLVLLCELLRGLPENLEFRLMLDMRAKSLIPLPSKTNTVWIKPNPLSRLWGEYLLKKIASRGDIVLFFHGIPPLFRCNSFNIVFIQNKFLLLKSFVNGGIYQSLRMLFERVLLRIGFSNVNVFIVQTSSMKGLLEQYFDSLKFRVSKINPQIKISSYFNSNIKEHTHKNTKNFDFIYISSGEFHKNHRNLFYAWKLLSNEGIFPTLGLTLSDDESLLKELRQYRSAFNLQITNLGSVPHSEISGLLLSSGALIFPSLHESLGLPLLEASMTNIPILASELDYVRDVCVPAETFNPNSPLSIARAVKRFLNHPDNLCKQIPVHEFIRNLIAMNTGR